jgi:hypothetical protein
MKMKWKQKSNTQRFLDEAESYSPSPSNVSSSSGADGIWTRVKYDKIKKYINSAKRRKYFDNYLSMGFTQESDKTSPLPVCVSCN